MNQIEHFVVFLWNCFAAWSCRREVQSSKWCLAWHEGLHILGGSYRMFSVITALSFNLEVPRAPLETMWTCITHDMLSLSTSRLAHCRHYTTMGSNFGLSSAITLSALFIPPVIWGQFILDSFSIFQVPLRVCVSSSRSPCIHTRVWHCACHHEAPVDLQMAEPAGTAAVLRGAGAGIRRSRGKI